MTLQDVLDIRDAQTRQAGRPIGVYPEIKYGSFHRSIGLPIEDKLIEALTRAGLNRASAPVIIQSFEQTNLKALKKKTDIKLMQLCDGSGTDPKTGTMLFKAPSDSLMIGCSPAEKVPTPIC